MDVDGEVKLLIQEIKRLGVRTEDGKFGVTFGTMFDDDRCQQVFEALVGTLRAAKKRKIISYPGQLLLKGSHDDVFIELLADE